MVTDMNHATEQTCKAFADICQIRSVWMSLLATLKDDEMPDLPPHIRLSTLNSTQLRSIVVDASRRNNIHLHACPPLPFTQLDLLHLPVNANATVTPQLLPGGEHVLVEIQGRIELWDLKTQSRLYEAPSESQTDYCATYAFDLVDSESELRVMLAVLFVREDATAYVRVFSYKFAENLGRVVLHRNLSVNFLWRPMMSGNVLMLHNASLLNVLLIDCQTGAATTIDFCPITVSQILPQC